jgi:hypothetical protein
MAAACADDRDPLAPSSKSSAALPSNLTPQAILDCVGTLAGGSAGMLVTCAPATVDGPAAAADPAVRQMIAENVTLSRQNVDVTLAFSGYGFASGVFSANVTVQNLLNQTLGDTITGNASVYGTRVFFMSNPPVAVTSGTGTATIQAPDTGTFTASFQPYYDYSAAIAPGATSAAQNWKFHLSSGVKGFTFSVEISTVLPAEKSIRRWVTLNQGLTGDSLTGTWWHTASDIYAVGAGGTVLQYNGTSWAAVSGIPATNYRAVSGVSGQAVASVWAVGDGGAVLHDTAGTWSAVTTGQTSNALYGVWVAGAGNVYAVGASGTVLHLSGGTWTKMSVPSGTGMLDAVWGNDATHIWAVGANGAVIFGNGSTWVKQTSATTQNLAGVWGDAATDVYAVGASGTIVHFTGSSWSAMSSGESGSNLAAIGGTASTDIWAVGDNGTTQHYNGSVWSTVGPNSGIPLTSVTSGSSSAIWAVGAQGSLLSSSGSAWHVSMQSGLTFYSVWASSATDVYVASLGTVLHYNGSSWTNNYVSPADSMDGIWGGGPQPATVYTVGENGWLGTLSGGTWTSQSIGTSVYSTWGPNTTSFYTGAGDGLVGYLNGSTLSSYNLGTSGNIMAIWGSSSNNVYAASSSGTIFNEKNTNGTWNQMTTPGSTGTLYAMYGSSSTDIYAVGASGVVLHNTGTNTWTAQASNTTNTLRSVWADPATSPYTADAYAVGDAGTVQHYNGNKWINMPAPVTSRFRGIFGTSSTNLYVVGDNGVVLLGTQ